MSIVTTPTLKEMCTIGLMKAGQPHPADGTIQLAMNHQFMEVMNDIKMIAPDHELLHTEAVLSTRPSVRFVNQPNGIHRTKSIVLVDGPDAWRGTVAAALPESVTLATTTAATEDDLKGLIIMTFGSTGGDPVQYRHIMAYNETTKTATVYPSYALVPSTITEYCVVTSRQDIYNTTSDVQNQDATGFARDAKPCTAYLEGEQLWFNASPDKLYGLIWTYYLDLDQLDRASLEFDKIIREWRSVITTGISAYSMEIYEDNRVGFEFQKYQEKLRRLQHETLHVGQTQPYDPY